MEKNKVMKIPVFVREGQAEITFTETDSSFGAIRVGEKYYTYACSQGGRKQVCSLIEEAIRTNPKTLEELGKSLTEIVLGDKGKALEAYFRAMEKEAEFTGAVLCSQHGQVLLCKGFGKAQAFVDNTSLTVFHIASLTKQFTAAAVMKLVEEKKIDLGASINEYLPSCFCSDEWDDVTVGHLLNHTSGIDNYADWDDYWDICKNLTPDKIIDDVKEEELLFSPGSEESYSNTGYTLLGKIIEKQSHMTYSDFIKQHILMPAGMTSSGVHDKGYIPTANSAVGYCMENQHLVQDPRDEFSPLFSDGSIYSTVRDMAKWSRVLDEKSSVLNRKSIEQMVKKEYGLFVDEVLGHKRIYHHGAMAGFRSNFCKFPDEDIFIVILSNNADFAVEYLTGIVSQFLLKSTPLPKLILFPPDFNFAPYLTTFRSKDEDEEKSYTFKLYQNQLFLEDEAPEKCFLLSNQRIFIPSVGMEFELQKTGKLFTYNGEGEKVDILTPVNEGLFAKLKSLFE